MKNTTKISLMSGLMFAGMALGGIHIANAQNNGNPEIDNSRYTVMIPSEVNIDKNTGKGSFAVTGKVKAQSTIDVSIQSKNGYKLKDKSGELPYNIDKKSFSIDNSRSASDIPLNEEFNIASKTNTKVSGYYTDSLSFDITSESYKYRLDVNGNLNENGWGDGRLDDFGRFDVYLNGKLVKENAEDFCEPIPYGTTWEIKNIRSLDGYRYKESSDIRTKGVAGDVVEVRIMYDDMGSLGTLPASYAKQLQKKGIKAVSFNRISPIINTIMNHRDHRKILVIDGKVAFSGGANLADEYINKKVKYGHWMDNIICVSGKAVWSYLVMFFTNWNALRHEDEDYTVFKNSKIVDETFFDGYIAPYAETPLDQELTGQSVYEDLLNSANEYVYIMTPYLIIDSEMINTLIHTAKKGVDVRIIMPGIADKQIVHDMGTTYYAQLIQGGVKIYEYEPGFVHSKVFISDDTYATVGTINLDYRSLYLHFENGTLLYKSKKILDVKQNFIDTLSKCKEIQIEDTHVNIVKGLFLSIIRIFSPLL